MIQKINLMEFNALRSSTYYKNESNQLQYLDIIQ